MSDKADWMRAFVAGSRLSAEEADALEAELATSPDRFAAHVTLLGFYDLSDVRRVPHILWLIEHHPGLGLVGLDVDESLSREGHREASRLWLAAVERDPTNTAIRINAVRGLQFSDEALAEKLLFEGVALYPRSAYWWNELAEFHEGLGRRDGDKARLRTAIDEYERARDLSAPEYAYAISISHAKAVFELGDLDRARTLAEQLLEAAPEFAVIGLDSEGIHWGNILLGRISVANGDFETARTHLAAAAEIREVDGFHPDEGLAAAFLKRGERDTVIAYIEAVRRFYSGPLGMLTGAYPFTLTVLDGGKS